MSEEFLNNVHRPAQYLGNEWNAFRKDFDGANLRVALGFPDLYEVGMSNLGLRIIYSILNGLTDVTCERFFSPEPDLELFLRKEGRPIFSLETGRALSEFDMLGFSLGSELNYTNVLNILELSGLPLEAKQRGSNHPLIIGGGPCTLNPEPIARFFDLFLIGEAEEAILELTNSYIRMKSDYRSNLLSKENLLAEFSKIEGIYVPSLYKDEQDFKIRKRAVPDLNAAFFPCNWLTPHIQTIHDRISLEIMRGCPNRCRFCQAKSQYYPLRIRSKENVISLARLSYASSGYEELSLAGLSVSDYPGLADLVFQLTRMFKEDSVNLSLPSLKAKSLLGNVSTLIAKIKKTGLTFAPEAGTARLRNVLGKDFSEEEFFKAAQEAYQAGYQHLKLYFLFGLPTETDKDLEGIINFAKEASELKRKVNAGPAQINISINPLIPKPHTPFQWLQMHPIRSLKEKKDYLSGRCKNRRIKLNFHNFEMAQLEGILSRGDRRLGKVILAAYKKGAKFDAWSDFFSYQKWMEAFAQEGIDPAGYLEEKPLSVRLPWDFIETGIEKENLVEEFKKCLQVAE